MIDKKTIETMLALPDDRLMQMISIAAGAAGINLGGKTPSAETVSGLRAVLSEVDNSDIARFFELVSLYKKAKKS